MLFLQAVSRISFAVATTHLLFKKIMSLTGPVLSIRLPVSSHNSVTLHSPIVSPTSSTTSALSDMQSIPSTQSEPANVGAASAAGDAFLTPPIQRERSNSAGSVTAVESVNVTEPTSPPATTHVCLQH